MKKIKLLAPILGIATISSAVVPMVGCSCKNNSAQQIDFGNITIAQSEKKYGFTGDLDAGTNYQFNVDISKWTTEYGKPSQQWSAVTSVWFEIYYPEEGKITGKDDIDASQAQIIVDGRTLVRDDDPTVQQPGKWYYGHSTQHPSGGVHQFKIAVVENNPVKEISKITLTNIKFKSNVQKICVCLEAIGGE